MHRIEHPGDSPVKERKKNMADYKKLALAYLDEKGIKYTIMEKGAVRIGFSGDNMDSIRQYLFFDEDGEPLLQTRCWDIAKFKESKRADGNMLCNDLNREYRWVRFTIDDDGDVNVVADCYMTADSAGPITFNIVNRMVNIIDDVYPRFMKALWG